MLYGGCSEQLDMQTLMHLSILAAAAVLAYDNYSPTLDHKNSCDIHQLLTRPYRRTQPSVLAATMKPFLTAKLQQGIPPSIVRAHT